MRQVFLIVATKDATGVRRAVHQHAAANYELKEDTWFATFEGTAREFAEKLGVRGGITGSGLVCVMADYSGRASKDAWEWLGVHWPQSG